MAKPAKFEFDWCDIEVNSEITISGGTSFKFVEKSDGEGNELPPADRPTFYHELDPYQTFKLAMVLLDSISGDIRDTRGSN